MVLSTRRKLTHGHKALYRLLIRRWGREGPCFPGQSYLARELGVHERTIRTWTDDPEASGLIERRRRGRGIGGRGQSDEYTFLWHLVLDRQDAPFLTGRNGGYEGQKMAVMTGKNQLPPYREEASTTESCTSTPTVMAACERGRRHLLHSIKRPRREFWVGASAEARRWSSRRLQRKKCEKFQAGC